MLFSFSKLKTDFFLFQQLLLHNFLKFTSVALYTILPVRLNLLFCTQRKHPNAVRTMSYRFPLCISPETLQNTCNTDVEGAAVLSLFQLFSGTAHSTFIWQLPQSTLFGCTLSGSGEPLLLSVMEFLFVLQSTVTLEC